ncbi:MAG: hypothetical protein IKD36_01535 [Clostridia bacterium]|nr:hypothetical protein [Clostridia bacterium]
MEKVCLGKVVKLHGYLGQMKVQTEYDKDFDANKIKEIVNDKDEVFKVTRIFKNTDGVVVKLEGVELEQAKTYIGKLLYIDRSVLGDKILFEDLKGSKVVFEDESELGEITDVQDYGTAEVITCLMKNGRELMFPNVKDLIVNFDYKQKKMVINLKRLKEVSDYEN